MVKDTWWRKTFLHGFFPQRLTVIDTSLLSLFEKDFNREKQNLKGDVLTSKEGVITSKKGVSTFVFLI